MVRLTPVRVARSIECIGKLTPTLKKVSYINFHIFSRRHLHKYRQSLIPGMHTSQGLYSPGASARTQPLRHWTFRSLWWSLQYRGYLPDSVGSLMHSGCLLAWSSQRCLYPWHTFAQEWAGLTPGRMLYSKQSQANSSSLAVMHVRGISGFLEEGSEHTT